MEGVRDRKVDKHETGLPHLRAACCSEYELQHDKSQTLGLSTQNTKYPKLCLKKKKQRSTSLTVQCKRRKRNKNTIHVISKAIIIIIIIIF